WFLGLFYRQRKRLGTVIFRSDFELRMAHSIDPLVAQPVKGLPGHLLYPRFEIGGLHVLPLILVNVMIDGFPEHFFAQNESQHVQHRAASRIRVSIKKGVRILVTQSHYWAAVPFIPGAKISLLIRVHFVKKFILTFVMLLP